MHLLNLCVISFVYLDTSMKTGEPNYLTSITIAGKLFLIELP